MRHFGWGWSKRLPGGGIAAFVLCLLVAGGAQAKDIASAAAGVSLARPAGYEGAYDADFGGYRLRKGDVQLGLFAYSAASVQDTALAVSTALEQAGVQIDYDHEPRYSDKGLFEAYKGQFQNQAIALHICAVAGSGGNAFSAVAMAPLTHKGAASELKALTEGLCKKIEWGIPTGTQWARLFWGRRLSAAGSASNYSQGGAGGSGSYASGTDEYYDFCRNGQYAYYYKRESFMSIEGMSASNTKTDSHSGQWWLVVDIGGRATMLMDSNDGRNLEFYTREQGEGVAMGDTYYTVSQSPQCY